MISWKNSSIFYVKSYFLLSGPSGLCLILAITIFKTRLLTWVVPYPIKEVQNNYFQEIPLFINTAFLCGRSGAHSNKPATSCHLFLAKFLQAHFETCAMNHSSMEMTILHAC